MVREALAGEDAASAREQVRASIDEVPGHPLPYRPEGGAHDRGRREGRVRGRHALKATKAPDALASGASVSMVAGARNQLELLTRG